MRTGTLATQAQVDQFLSQDGKQSVSDSKSRGLQLERLAPGKGTWRLRYTGLDGRTRRCLTLGDAGVLTLAQARQLADKARNKIAMGVDPCEEKAAVKAVPTFAQFAARYLEFVRGYKRSWQTDESLLRNHLLPRFGKKYLDEITRDDVLRMHRTRLEEGAKPGSANRLLIMMRYMFNLALRWEVPHLVANPTQGVPLYEENNQRDRYLSSEEAQRLYRAVCASESPMLRYIVPMLILTGARKREVLDARWEDLDVVNRRWRIAMTKSGKARHVPLSDGALQVLQLVPRLSDCAWVFANPATRKPFVSIFYAWNTARTRAGLADVRIHDLRHSFASLLVNSGRTLYEVQHLLGHTQIKTTQRYAHLSQETLLEAANAATKAVGTVMLGPYTAL
ncbi:MAG: tyrosine-type recombinase/integrase [Comamonas sp.]|nr:tyrosine-type recombinase/integrase [Comamonas sp.]